MTSDEKGKRLLPHIEAQRNSGLSGRAYCEKEGIGYSMFMYWRKRLVGRARKKSAAFVEVRPNELRGEVSTVTIETSSGLKLSFSGTPPVKWLVELMQSVQ